MTTTAAADMSSPKVVTWLDGGLSTALERLGCSTRHALWTARALVDAPDLVVTAHRHYVTAGAQMVLTASYQAGVANLTQYTGSRSEARRVLASSVACARQAAAQAVDRSVRVAASLGAFGALLADGSEYHGRYPTPWRDVAREQRERLEVLLDAGPDVVVCETLPTVTEAAVLLDILDDLMPEHPTIEVWITFTAIDGGRTAGGDALVAVGDLIVERPWVRALGVNCTDGRHVAAALDALRSVYDGPLVAKPNAGGRWDVDRGTWRSVDGVDLWRTRVPEWVRRGARHVGGCCGVGPAELASIISSTT